MKKKTSISLTSSELKKFLKHIISNNQQIQEKGKVPVAVNIEGEAGLGKTSVILQVANELGLQCIKLNLSQIEEIGDIVGFPMKEHEVIKNKDGENIIKWVSESTLPMYISSGFKPSGNKRMTHAAPEWIQGKGEGGILILDDWTRADIRFVQAVMEIIDRQEYISWKLPKNWHVVLTSNPDNGEYLVNSIDNAQRTRFITTYLKFDKNAWAQWAEENSIDSRCINFVLMHPEIIDNGVNPRSITTFFNSISSLDSFDGDNLALVQMIGEGSVGAEVSTIFTTFIANKLDKIIDPHDVITKCNWDNVRDSIHSVLYDTGRYRADIASLLVTRIVNYTIYYSKSNKIDDKIIDRIKDLVKEEELFALDNQYIMIKGLIAGDKSKFQKLLMDPEITKIAVK
jgi:hypothetical protein